MGKKKPLVATQPPATNGWDFLLKISDIFYNLLDAGKIAAAMLWILGIIDVIILVRYPSKELPELLHDVVTGVKALIKTGYAYNILVTCVAITSIIGNIVQKRVYKKEINRLVGLRRSLIHGYELGELKTLSSHNSSDREES